MQSIKLRPQFQITLSFPQNWGAVAIAWGAISLKLGSDVIEWGAQLEQDSQTNTLTPELGSAFQRRGRALARLPISHLKILNLTPSPGDEAQFKSDSHP